MEQISIFRYLESLPFLADSLKEHCRRWNYDWLDKLAKCKTVETFIKHFCNVTTTYYFYKGEDFFGAVFDKKNKTVGIYVCGKQYTGEFIEEYEINDLIELL